MHRVLSEVNECNLFKGVCHQNCVNTPRGYRCTCSQGYELNENGISCTGMTVIYFARVEGVGEGVCWYYVLWRGGGGRAKKGGSFYK